MFFELIGAMFFIWLWFGGEGGVFSEESSHSDEELFL